MSRKYVLRIVSLLCIAAFVFTSFAVPGFASDTLTDAAGRCGEKLFWNYDSASGTLRIYGEGNMYNYRHYTAADGAPPWSPYRIYIKHLIVEEGCSRIGDYAFTCSSIRQIDFPRSSLKSIGEYAFLWNDFTELEIPDSVVYVGKGAFKMCRKLVSVKLGQGLNKILGETFYEMPSLKEVVLSPGIKEIGTRAFYNCPELEYIDLSYVERLGNYAFYSCAALKEVKLGKNLKYIGACVFEGSAALEKVTLISYPEKIATSYDSGTAQYNNRERGMYTLFDGKVLCNKGRFAGDTIVIPDGVEMISDYCFSNAYYFTNLVIPESVRVIGDNSFFNARSLEDVYIPASVERIGERNFGYLQEGTHDYFNAKLRIHGKYGSAAHKYAMDNGLIFVCEHEFKTTCDVPDCAEGGYIYTICDCGYVSERISVAPTSHRGKTTASEASCAAEGFIRTVCEDCGKLLSEKTIPKKAHDTSGGYKVTAAPTCTSDGELCRICLKCGEVLERRVIEKRGHSESLTVFTVPADCTKEGRTDKICPDCGETVESTPISKTGHIPDGEERAITRPNDAANIPGLRASFCTVCRAAVCVRWYFADGRETDAKSVGAFVISSAERAVCGDDMLPTRTENFDFDSNGKITVRDILTLKRIVG